MSELSEIVDAELRRNFEPSKYAGRSVTVAVPDATRPIDYEDDVGPLLAALERAGAEMTVLVGVGLHRAMTDAEIAPLRRVAERHGARLVQHDAVSDDLIELSEDVGAGRDGWPVLPARFHRSVVEADRVISVGTVEPHQYAGFSGGVKGVAIGCASRETVSGMHGLEFLRMPGTRLGAIDGNPFRQALRALTEPLGEFEALQIVPPGAAESRTPAVTFGPVREAFERAVAIARERFFQPFDEPVDWFHLPVSESKAVNFYQASRAATYAALVSRPALREGGTLFVEAACSEGIGEGRGERACAEAMQRGKDALLRELQSDESIRASGGQQRAYVLALALDFCDIVLVGADAIDGVESMGIASYDTIREAKDDLGVSSRGMTVDDVFHGVPVLARHSSGNSTG